MGVWIRDGRQPGSGSEGITQCLHVLQGELHRRSGALRWTGRHGAVWICGHITLSRRRDGVESAVRLDHSVLAGIRIERKQPPCADSQRDLVRDRRVQGQGEPHLRTAPMKTMFAAALIAYGMAWTSAQEQPQSDHHEHHSSWNYEALSHVPDRDKARMNPLDGDPDAIQAGEKLFMQHCVECHGDNLGGTSRGINLMDE